MAGLRRDLKDHLVPSPDCSKPHLTWPGTLHKNRCNVVLIPALLLSAHLQNHCSAALMFLSMNGRGEKKVLLLFTISSPSCYFCFKYLLFFPLFMSYHSDLNNWFLFLTHSSQSQHYETQAKVLQHTFYHSWTVQETLSVCFMNKAPVPIFEHGVGYFHSGVWYAWLAQAAFRMVSSAFDYSFELLCKKLKKFQF